MTRATWRVSVKMVFREPKTRQRCENAAEEVRPDIEKEG